MRERTYLKGVLFKYSGKVLLILVQSIDERKNLPKRGSVPIFRKKLY